MIVRYKRIIVEQFLAFLNGVQAVIFEAYVGKKDGRKPYGYVLIFIKNEQAVTPDHGVTACFAGFVRVKKQIYSEFLFDFYLRPELVPQTALFGISGVNSLQSGECGGIREDGLLLFEICIDEFGSFTIKISGTDFVD